MHDPPKRKDYHAMWMLWAEHIGRRCQLRRRFSVGFVPSIPACTEVLLGNDFVADILDKSSTVFSQMFSRRGHVGVVPLLPLSLEGEWAMGVCWLLAESRSPTKGRSEDRSW